MIPFINLTKQYLSIKEEIDSAIHKVLMSGWLILGEEVASFEKEFAEFVGTTFGVGVGSGTEALHVGLLACGINPGDEVITVSHTAVATVAAIELTGAKPIFVDIDPTSYTMESKIIAAAITSKTKAILPVHLYGQPADMTAILEIARCNGLKVIEDCAQAHGGTYRGQSPGSMGDIGCYSFYPTKNLGANGDGGMIVTKDPSLYDRLLMLRQYGWGERYVSKIRGLNSRLDELQAAILRVKLRHLNEWLTRRKNIAEIYDCLLAEGPVLLPREYEDRGHAHHLYVVECEKRDELQKYLLSLGIKTLIHYPVPIHLQKAYTDLGYKEGGLPVTEKAANRVLSLPLYPEMTDDEVEKVAMAVKQFPIK